jgi:hypothetical protein
MEENADPSEESTPMTAERGPYRPRLARSPSGSRAEFTDRDLAVLELVADHRVLTQSLVLAALPLCGHTASPTNMGKRLKEMFEDEYLDRILPARRETFHGDAFAYAITAKGEKKLRDAQLELPFPPGSNWKRRNEQLSKNPPFTRHALMTARVRIAIELGLREIPELVLETSERENQLLQAKWTHRGTEHRVIPDAFVKIRDRAQPDGPPLRSLFIEADRGSMETRRMVPKFADYCLLPSSGLDREVFGVRDFLVLVIAETEVRATFLLNLIALAEDDHPIARGRARFLVTTEELYRDHLPNVFAQIWRSGAKPEERASIVPSPLPWRK